MIATATDLSAAFASTQLTNSLLFYVLVILSVILGVLLMQQFAFWKRW